MNVIKYDQLFENKMWYKTIPQILSWLKSKSNMTWVWIDTETTGLGGPKKQQLTQISAISTKYNFSTNSFKELNVFDEKIKLTDETKSKYNDEEDKTKWVLSFNHYGTGGYKYKEEQGVINGFFEWMEQFNNPFLIAQNATFDMNMLSGRGDHNINYEVFDTKLLIQLYYLPLVQKLSESDTKYKELIEFIGTSDRDSGLISSSMSKIGPALGITMDNYHDALTDCRITIGMYTEIIKFLEEFQDQDISNYQIDRIKTKRK